MDAGQVVKVAKDKKGVVTREVLTRKWTDWIDYWSVDFDYHAMDRRLHFRERMAEFSDPPRPLARIDQRAAPL